MELVLSPRPIPNSHRLQREKEHQDDKSGPYLFLQKISGSDFPSVHMLQDDHSPASDSNRTVQRTLVRRLGPRVGRNATCLCGSLSDCSIGFLPSNACEPSWLRPTRSAQSSRDNTSRYTKFRPGTCLLHFCVEYKVSEYYPTLVMPLGRCHLNNVHENKRNCPMRYSLLLPLVFLVLTGGVVANPAPAPTSTTYVTPHRHPLPTQHPPTPRPWFARRS